jgi:hypothetical protein
MIDRQLLAKLDAIGTGPATDLIMIDARADPFPTTASRFDLWIAMLARKFRPP